MAKLISLNGKKYVAGLFWQNFPDENYSRQAVIKKMASKFASEAVDGYCISHSGLEYGLGSSINDKRLFGKPSLLDSLDVETLPVTVIGRVNLGEYTWVFFLHQKRPVGDCDFIGPSKDADAFFEKLKLTRSGYEEISIEDPEEGEEFLTARLRKRSNKFKRVYKKEIGAPSLFLILIVAALGTYFYAFNPDDSIPRSKDQSPITELEMKKLFPEVWRDHAPIDFFSNRCVAKIREQLLLDKGWQFDNGICTSNGVTNSHYKITRTREEYGSFEHRPAGFELSSKNPNFATQQSRMVELSKRPNHELMRRDVISEKIWDIARSEGLDPISIHLKWRDEERKKLLRTQKIYRSKWLLGTFKIENLQQDPLPLITKLSKLPGIVLPEITARYDESIFWNIKGRIYAKNK